MREPESVTLGRGRYGHLVVLRGELVSRQSPYTQKTPGAGGRCLSCYQLFGGGYTCPECRDR